MSGGAGRRAPVVTTQPPIMASLCAGSRVAAAGGLRKARRLLLRDEAGRPVPGVAERRLARLPQPAVPLAEAQTCRPPETSITPPVM